MTAVAPTLEQRTTTARTERTVPLVVAAFASLAAGAIHATAIGSHSGQSDMVKVFTATAAFQVGWGALALLRPHRVPLALGIVGNGAALGGWIAATNGGVSFIEGMDADMAPGRADTLAAILAGIAVLGSVIAVLRPRLGSSTGTAKSTAFIAVAGIASLAMGVAGMDAAASPNHHGGGEAAAGHAHGDDEDDEHAAGDDDHHAAEPVPFDPALPIDLSGTPGVTPAQQAAAENIISATLLALPHWEDFETAEAEGFRSIGDGGTGSEHFINWEFAADDEVLNPYRPESLMYDTTGGGRRLVAAMYMAAPGTPLEDVPELGGPLTQWHIHNDLCFTQATPEEGPRVGGLVNADGTCDAPLQQFPHTPMIHVWIEPHPCGPFAALEGIGAGQIAEGETRLCDSAHGH
jgi:hypothetical protein